MARLTPRQVLDRIRLVDRRSRGLEPGDDVGSRLRLHEFPAAPWPWLKRTVAKLAVVFIIAALAASLFSGGLAVMRAMGDGR